MSPVALRSPPVSSLARRAGARKRPFPGFIAPCDPVQHETPPAEAGWLYEIKVDGYRAQLHVRHGNVRVYSRRGLDWTAQFSTIAQAAAALTGHDLVIDGEAVVYGAAGLPDFQQLRRELGEHKSGRLVYHAFDLLYLDGYDLRGVAYVERKRRLEALLGEAPKTFIYVEYLEADGRRVVAQGCKMGLEGVVAKRADAPYRSGRSETWVKVKCVKS